MPPNNQRRDELAERLERKIDELALTVSGLQLTMERVAAGLDQMKGFAAAATLRMDSIEARLSALEAVRQRAEGAVWAWRLAFAGAAAIGGALAHWVLK